MAGSFWFEEKHYDISLTMGKRRLAPDVAAQPFSAEFVASSASCRQQVEYLSGHRAKHLGEVMRETLL
jgi:hypothetical protein